MTSSQTHLKMMHNLEPSPHGLNNSEGSEAILWVDFVGKVT